VQATPRMATVARPATIPSTLFFIISTFFLLELFSFVFCFESAPLLSVTDNDAPALLFVPGGTVLFIRPLLFIIIEARQFLRRQILTYSMIIL
jgi:hypothetical protein